MTRTADAQQPLLLHVNGRPLDVAEVDPHMTLLHFLRAQGLTGTKEGCAEGECGACAVVVLKEDQDGSRYVPINSCLVLARNVAGESLITVEGVADGDALHPVQTAMVEEAGSQCGYCTPGFVMSLFAEYYRKDRRPGEGDIESIAGNLCRCTGYRPIRDALVSLKLPSGDDAHLAALKAPAPNPPASQSPQFARPTTLAGVWEAWEASPEATLLGGGTDLVVGINQFDQRHRSFIALDRTAELRGIEETTDEIIIGAGVPLSEVEAHFHGDPRLGILEELFVLFSSRLIRNRATFGGNLVNASPIGDSPPALLALDAELELATKDGTRRVPLAEFFVDYRKTVLNAQELVTKVVLAKPLPEVARFFKVSKRVMDDISTVAAGFAFWTEDGVVTKARLAYGGVAATPVRAKDAETLLEGTKLGPSGELTFDEGARQKLLDALASAFTPIGDHRGSADYRKAMVTRLFEKFISEEAAAKQAAE